MATARLSAVLASVLDRGQVEAIIAAYLADGDNPRAANSPVKRSGLAAWEALPGPIRNAPGVIYAIIGA